MGGMPTYRQLTAWILSEWPTIRPDPPGVLSGINRHTTKWIGSGPTSDHHLFRAYGQTRHWNRPRG